MVNCSSLLRRYSELQDVLKELPPEFYQISNCKTFAPGEIIVERDAPVEYVYFLLRGEASVYSVTYDGKLSIWMRTPAPVFISDLELLAGEKTYAANVGAVTRCETLCAKAEEFLPLLRKNIQLLWLSASFTAKKNYASSHDRGYTAFFTSVEKTAAYILRYCTRTPPSEDVPTTIRKTRDTIAGELVLSIKTLERCLNILRDEHCVSIIKGKITVDQKQYQRLHREFEYCM